MPSIHMKSWEQNFCTGDVERGETLGVTGHPAEPPSKLVNSRFSKRSCLKKIWWRMVKKDIPQWLLASTYMYAHMQTRAHRYTHTHVHTWAGTHIHMTHTHNSNHKGSGTEIYSCSGAVVLNMWVMTPFRGRSNGTLTGVTYQIFCILEIDITIHYSREITAIK